MMNYKQTIRPLSLFAICFLIINYSQPAIAGLEPQVLNSDIIITVTGHDDMIALKGDISRSLRKDGLKAVAVKVLIENNSAAPIPVYWASFKLKDQDQEIAEPSIFATGKRPYLNITTLQPNDKIAAWISFEAKIGIQLEKSVIRYDQIPNGYSDLSMISDWFPIKADK